MSVVVTIRDPGGLVDQQVGITGAGALASSIGLGGALASIVDGKAADEIRSALSAKGVAADVYTTDNPPGSSGPGSSDPVLLVALVVLGFALARLA